MWNSPILFYIYAAKNIDIMALKTRAKSFTAIIGLKYGILRSPINGRF